MHMCKLHIINIRHKKKIFIMHYTLTIVRTIACDTFNPACSSLPKQKQCI